MPIGPVQSQIWGFPSLFGIKGGGGPNLLGDEIRLSQDITQQLLVASREIVTMGAVAAPAAGVNFFTSNGTVPSGELWYIWIWMVQLVSAVGNTGKFGAAFAFGGTQSSIVTVAQPFIASETRSVPVYHDQIPWATQGDSFMANLEAPMVGTPTTVTARAVISRLRV